MKNKYIKPITHSVIVKTQNQILLGSADPKFDPTKTTTTMDSRQGGGLWEDEDF